MHIDHAPPRIKLKAASLYQFHTFQAGNTLFSSLPHFQVVSRGKGPLFLSVSNPLMVAILGSLIFKEQLDVDRVCKDQTTTPNHMRRQPGQQGNVQLLIMTWLPGMLMQQDPYGHR